MRAMILAAGRGERMRPLTDSTPKPLLAVGGKPLIQWHIERLAQAGIQTIVINHAWLGQQIEETLGNGSRWNVQLQYSAESTALETAGGIANALPLLGSAPFLVINGDVWCDWNPVVASALARQLQQQHQLAWLLLCDNPPHHPQGDFPLARFPELANSSTDKLSGTTASTSTLTFSGIGIYHPQLFAGIIPGQAARLGPLLHQAIENGGALGHHYKGQWFDIGTPQRLHTLNCLLGQSASQTA